MPSRVRELNAIWVMGSDTPISSEYSRRRRKFRAAGEFSAFYLLQNIFPRRLKFV